MTTLTTTVKIAHSVFTYEKKSLRGCRTTKEASMENKKHSNHFTKSLSLTDCLESIERRWGFKGDAAILVLTWAIAAHLNEMEVG